MSFSARAAARETVRAAADPRTRPAGRRGTASRASPAARRSGSPRARRPASAATTDARYSHSRSMPSRWVSFPPSRSTTFSPSTERRKLRFVMPPPSSSTATSWPGHSSLEDARSVPSRDLRLRPMLVEHPESVAIVAFRGRSAGHGASRRGRARPSRTVELPSGKLEPGETPARGRRARAGRGVRARRGVDWREVGGFWAVPAYSTEFVHVFEAGGVASAPEPLAADDDEDIEVRLVPVERALDELSDAVSIAAFAALAGVGLIRAVVFDFNGTLSDDEPILCEVWQEIAAEHGRPLTTRGVLRAARRPLRSRDRRALAGRRRRRAHGRAGAALPRARRRRVDRRVRRCATSVRFAAERVPVAVVSGAAREEIELVLGAAGLTDAISTIVAAEDVQRGQAGSRGLPARARTPGRERLPRRSSSRTARRACSRRRRPGRAASRCSGRSRRNGSRPRTRSSSGSTSRC